MKVLEQTPTRLVIKDGSRLHKMYLLHSLIDEKWHGLLNILSILVIIGLGVAWITGKIPRNLQSVGVALLFILAGPIVLDIAIGEKDTPKYVFDKSIDQMTITNGKFTQRFVLSDVVDVIAVNTESMDPPPTYWREIHLILRLGQELKLYPGHGHQKKQEELTALLRQFLNLN
jgi:hypothetical protein